MVCSHHLSHEGHGTTVPSRQGGGVVCSLCQVICDHPQKPSSPDSTELMLIMSGVYTYWTVVVIFNDTVDIQKLDDMVCIALGTTVLVFRGYCSVHKSSP